MNKKDQILEKMNKYIENDIFIDTRIRKVIAKQCCVTTKYVNDILHANGVVYVPVNKRILTEIKSMKFYTSEIIKRLSIEYNCSYRYISRLIRTNNVPNVLEYIIL